jgi:hypothetical protein
VKPARIRGVARQLAPFTKALSLACPDLSCRLFGENDSDLTGIGQFSRNGREFLLCCVTSNFENNSELARMGVR